MEMLGATDAPDAPLGVDGCSAVFVIGGRHVAITFAMRKVLRLLLFVLVASSALVVLFLVFSLARGALLGDGMLMPACFSQGPCDRW